MTSTTATLPAALPLRIWWRCAGAAVALNHLTLMLQTQPRESTIMAALLWYGAYLCAEHALATEDQGPGAAGLLLGPLLLGWGIWRGAQVIHFDSAVYGLPLVQGFGLALLLLPLRRLAELRSALVLLASFALMLVLPRVIPVELLSLLGAKLMALMLNLVGQDAFLSGREVWLPGGGVLVADACSGVNVIVQTTLIAVIFNIAFPFRRWGLRALSLLIAPVIAFAYNTVRITTLAFINGSHWPDKRYWFDLVHQGDVGLAFSGLAGLTFVWIHYQLIDRQLASEGH